MHQATSDTERPSLPIAGVLWAVLMVEALIAAAFLALVAISPLLVYRLAWWS